MLGRMHAFILAPSAGEVERVREEALERFSRFAGQFDKFEATLSGQPDRHWQSIFRFGSDLSPDFGKLALQYSFVFLVLLLVPAISLSGMTDSRMERRLAEMGVRRAFGAPRNILMRQVILENFLFTLLGGFAGLLFSYFLILVSSRWIMSLGQTFAQLPPEGAQVVFTPSMLFNLPVFCIALSVCFALNLLSALVPAWKVSHSPVIHTLNT
jgi:putative ABC transport system permease protein